MYSQFPTWKVTVGYMFMKDVPMSSPGSRWFPYVLSIKGALGSHDLEVSRVSVKKAIYFAVLIYHHKKIRSYEIIKILWKKNDPKNWNGQILSTFRPYIFWLKQLKLYKFCSNATSNLVCNYFFFIFQKGTVQWLNCTYRKYELNRSYNGGGGGEAVELHSCCSQRMDSLNKGRFFNDSV